MYSEGPSRATLWLPAIILVCSLPLTILYLVRLWEWPHYQFFPILIGAVAYILWQRWSELRATNPPGTLSRGPFASLVTIWAGLGIETIAILLFSPWLGYLGFLVIGAGVLWYLTGPEWRRFLAAWALLLLIVRPPLRMDEVLIAGLQQSTARQSSAILDHLGAQHLREGVIIEIPGRTLFVEEACSGVQSLFSLIAMAGLMVVWNRRPLLWSLLLFIAAAVGAAGMNIFRTVSIVYALHRYNIDLLAEPAHTILGLVVFIGSLLWLMCFDMLLAFLLSPISGHQVYDENGNMWVALWNRWIGGLRGKKGTATGYSVTAGIPAWRRWGMVSASGIAAVLCASSIWAIGSASLASTTSNERVAPVGQQPIVEQLKSLGELSVPEQLGNWSKLDYKRTERNIRSMFGDVSDTWRFQTPYGTAVCAVDFPFLGWHDLRRCYTATGWHTIEEEPYSVGQEPASRVRMLMQKPTGEQAYLLFGSVTSTKEPFQVPDLKTQVNSLGRRLAFIVQDVSTEQPVSFQFQTMVVSSTPLTEAERKDVEKHYELFRDTILSQIGPTGVK